MAHFQQFEVSPIQFFADKWQAVVFPEKLCKFILAVGWKNDRQYYIIFGATFLTGHRDQWDVLKEELAWQGFSEVDVLGGAWINKVKDTLFLVGESDLGSLSPYAAKVKELIRQKDSRFKIELGLD